MSTTRHLRKSSMSSPHLRVEVVRLLVHRLAGGDILAINEFVEEARNTYRDNYPTTPIVPDDIKELTGQNFLDLTGLKKGELDILDGSPPCSAFSVAGKLSHSSEGKHSDGWGQTKTYGW